MKESEVTGYSEEGCCDEPQGAVGYEPEVVYEAHVNAYVSIYFMFSRRQNVKRVSIMRSDVSDGIWTNYTLGTVTEIHHNVPLGMWILRIHVGCQPDWLFKDRSSGNLHTPTISKAWGKHHPDEGRRYNMVIEDDIVSRVSTPEGVRKAVVWYERVGGKYVKKKEVKKKMTNKSLFHVILFNRKTEEIEFDVIIPANNGQDATMQAAQLHGKYDSKMHLTIVWQLQYSEYTPIKD